MIGIRYFTRRMPKRTARAMATQRATINSRDRMEPRETSSTCLPKTWTAGSARMSKRPMPRHTSATAQKFSWKLGEPKARPIFRPTGIKPVSAANRKTYRPTKV